MPFRCPIFLSVYPFQCAQSVVWRQLARNERALKEATLEADSILNHILKPWGQLTLH